MRKLPLILVAVALGAACSSGGGDVVKNDTADLTGKDTAQMADLASVDPDLSTGEIGDRPSDSGSAEVAPEVETGCPVGSGCFMDPCVEGVDCWSGYCVMHMGTGVCSQQCLEECPAGFECTEVSLTAPDYVFVCSSQFPALCLPCSAGAECEELAGLAGACVSYGEGQGHFCASVCSGDGDCPDGFECRQVATVEGLLTAQCMRIDGTCPCSDFAVLSSLSTTCYQTSDFGVCEGSRTCGADGLSDCDAEAPTEETCDGKDNNCDGAVDEVSCDDGNPCTADQCLGEEGCQNAPATGGECLDGDACTIGDHCEEGLCVGALLVCDDQNPCTDEICDSELGCQYEFNSLPCDDSNPCTYGDTCLAGQCVGLPGDCDCQADGDCLFVSEANKCLGEFFCDKSQSPYQCVQKPGTEVLCPASSGADADCYLSQCVPETGECQAVDINQGKPCDEGDKCTVAETCLDGECQGGISLNCNDDNQCTDDFCEPAAGCIHLEHFGPCTDWDACSEGDHCEEGICLSGAPLVCDDNNPCTDDVCDPLSGCAHENAAGPCDDGNACTVGDSCTLGWCVPAGYVDCDDDNHCTADLCDELLGCVHSNEAVPCSDGDACTVGDECVNGACAPGAPASCSDGNDCTDNWCEPDVGCVTASNDAECDDGNACTSGDHCEEGWCVWSLLEECDDGNQCTDDACDPAAGCTYSLNDDDCDDGNLCTVGDVCALGSCIAGGELPCNDGNLCTADSCKPGVGCEFVPTAAECDDGNACTSGDHCEAGACVAAEMADCNDSNICTHDFCLPAEGCQHAPLQAACDDGSKCTAGDYCDGGACVPGPAVDCDDGNQCTLDECTPADGCLNIPQPGPCDDGDPCTVDDQCDGEACVPGPPFLCDDGTECTEDWCDPVQLCVFDPVPGGCDDGNACTEDDSCVDGDCVGGPLVSCDDGDQCTADSCQPEDGCHNDPIAPCCGNGELEGGEECDDGNIQPGDGCDALCHEEGTCFADWKTELSCSGQSYNPPCQPGDPGYHWKGIYQGYACWYHHKNQAWNTTTATNFWHLALAFELTPGSGRCSWCHNKSEPPNPNGYGNCSSYFQQGDVGAWGYCGETVGFVCIPAAGQQPCN